MKSIPSHGGAPAPGISVRNVLSQDIDEHTRQQDGWSLRYDQLDCGRFEGRFVDLRCGSAQIFVESTARAVRQRGRLAPQSCCTAVPLTQGGAMYLDGIQIEPQSMLLASEDADIELCTPSDFTLVGLLLQAQELRDTMALLDEPADRHTGRSHLLAMQVDAPSLTGWRDRLLTIVHAAREQPELLASDQVQRQLHDELLLQQALLLANAAPTDSPARSRAGKRLVDRACEFVLSRSDQPLSLLDVCREVGASPRKLGYCFQNTLGLSPARFIKITRLNAVRRALSQAEPGQSVYDTAARWGFWHFGHFSTDYKKQFSESPSDTLRRALRGSGGARTTA